MHETLMLEWVRGQKHASLVLCMKTGRLSEWEDKRMLAWYYAFVVFLKSVVCLSGSVSSCGVCSKVVLHILNKLQFVRHREVQLLEDVVFSPSLGCTSSSDVFVLWSSFQHFHTLQMEVNPRQTALFIHSTNGFINLLNNWIVIHKWRFWNPVSNIRNIFRNQKREILWRKLQSRKWNKTCWGRGGPLLILINQVLNFHQLINSFLSWLTIFHIANSCNKYDL